MARQFTCPNCEAPIQVRFLKPGEECECKNCFQKSVVPEDAEEVEASALLPARNHAQDDLSRPHAYLAPSTGGITAIEYSADTETKTTKTIEVKIPQGYIKEFDDYNELRQEIISGAIERNSPARFKADNGSPNTADGKESNWSTIEAISAVDFKLQTLFKPVWAHAQKGLWIGAIVGTIIKAIDTATLFAAVDGSVLFMWLLVGGGIAAISFTKKGWMVAAMAGYFSLKFGINLFAFMGAWFSTILVGGFYGSMAGLAVGTVVGYLRRRSISRAGDAAPEGKKPVLTGLVLPLAVLAVAVPVHIFWLNPQLVEWLS